MLGGYMGRLLWVDLTTGSMHEEIPDDALLRRRCAQLWEWQADFCKTNPEYVQAIEGSHHV